jgi:hypothetical protein
MACLYAASAENAELGLPTGPHILGRADLYCSRTKPARFSAPKGRDADGTRPGVRSWPGPVTIRDLKGPERGVSHRLGCSGRWSWLGIVSAALKN